jgi:hypothetical protein
MYHTYEVVEASNSYHVYAVSDKRSFRVGTFDEPLQAYSMALNIANNTIRTWGDAAIHQDARREAELAVS